MDYVENDDFQCEKCGKCFKERKGLKQHQNRKKPCDAKPEYRCEKCGKLFTRSNDYQRHINERKTPCDPILGNVPPEVSGGENKCQFCGRTFKQLRRHIDKCRIANNKKVFDGQGYVSGMEVLVNLTKAVEVLTKKVDNMNMNTTNNYTQINIGAIVNIQINSFDGKQQLDKIDSSEVVKMLNLNLTDIVPALTQLVHANDRIPENHNMFLPNKSKNDVLVIAQQGDKKVWQAKDIREVYNILMKRGVDLLYKADDELSAIGKLLTDEEGDRFEMLINKQRSGSVYDEDIESIKPILEKVGALAQKTIAQK